MRRIPHLVLALPILALVFVGAAPASAGGVTFSLGAGFSVGNVAVHLAYASPGYGYLPYYYRTPVELHYPGYACTSGCLKSAAYWYHAPSCPLILFHFDRFGYSGYLDHYHSHDYYPYSYGYGHRYPRQYDYRYRYRSHRHYGHHGHYGHRGRGHSKHYGHLRGHGKGHSKHYGSVKRTRPSYRSKAHHRNEFRSHGPRRHHERRHDVHRSRGHEYRSDHGRQDRRSSVKQRSSRGRHGDHDRGSGKARRTRPRDH